MIINHNISAMNTNRQLGVNNSNSSKSLEKLSSGFRINRAGDDAAGLAISEKMRGQIRGLDQASTNSQDAISMLQTAEGNLSETENILQRMKELATKAANDTLATEDAYEVQKEINALTSEINKIGNTTEFNTKKLLRGDGQANLTATGIVTNSNLTGGEVKNTQASQGVTISAAAANNQTIKFRLNGQDLTVTFATNAVGDDGGKATNVTANSAKVNLHVGDAANSAATAASDGGKALQQIIDANADLKGNFVVETSGATLTIKATSSGLYPGETGNVSVVGGTGSVAGATVASTSVGATEKLQAKATKVANFASVNSAAKAKALIGTGLTIGGQQVEFYNANDGAYKGNAIGVNISDVIAKGTNATGADIIAAMKEQAGPQLKDVVLSENAETQGMLDVTAKVGGQAGNNIRVTDGGVQKQFQAIFQIGANQGQSMTININDMRSAALGIAGKTSGTDTATGANFTTTTVANNGTDDVLVEAALDVTGHANATNAIKTLDNAIAKVSAERSNLGAFTNRLEHTVNNLGTSSENMSAAESRIRDVDMAKEMMAYSKNNILSQAATAMLAKANQQPEGVLQLLR